MEEVKEECEKPFEEFRSPRVTLPFHTKTAIKSNNPPCIPTREHQNHALHGPVLAKIERKNTLQFCGLLQDDTNDQFIKELKKMMENVVTTSA